MHSDSENVGIIVISITVVVVLLLSLTAGLIGYIIYLRNNIQKCKDLIKKYELISENCIKVIDILTVETKKVGELMECVIKGVNEFKKSKIYKEYQHGNKHNK